jgi:hypothetical protein
MSRKGARVVLNPEQLGTYVEALYENQDVRDNLARMRANLRAANRRAGSRKSVLQAADDPGVRARLVESARAGRAALAAVREGPQPPSPWPRRFALIGAMAAVAAATALYQSKAEETS